MADQLQLRGGSTAEHSTFTGALREVTVDIDKDTVVVHDNATAGGHPLLREDLSNLPAGTIDNADINANAEIAVSKLADGAARQLLQTDSAGTGVEWTSNVDVPGTLDVTGAATFDSTATVGGSNVVTVGDTGTVTSAMIANGTIVNEDVNAAAAIAGTKIDPDFGSQTVETTGIFSAAGGSAAAPSIAFTGDTNTGIYSPGEDQVAVATSGVGRLFINASGRVGVNKSSPVRTFEIEDPNARASLTSTTGTNGVFWLITNTGGSLVAGRDDSTGAIYGQGAYASHIRSGGAYPLVLSTDNTPALTIDSSQRVGLGTSSPSYRLDVKQNVATPICHIETGSTGNNVLLSLDGSSGFASGGGARMRFGRATQGNNSVEIGYDHDSLGFQVTRNGSVLLTAKESGVGIGTTSPGQTLHVNAASGDVTGRFSATSAAGTNSVVGFIAGTSGTAALQFGDSGSSDIGQIRYENSNDSMVFNVNGSNRATIDSSGRLLVGTSTARAAGGLTASFQLEGTSAATGTASIIRNGGNPYLKLYRTGSASLGSVTAIGANAGLAEIDFGGSDGSTVATGAYIVAVNDSGSAWTSSSHPTRLAFFTTASGASTPTERVRITSNGATKITTSGSFNSNSAYHEIYSATDGYSALQVTNTGTTAPYGIQVWFKDASPDDNSRTFFECVDSTAFRARIYSDGDVWTSDAGTLTSDVTLKRDITDASPKLAEVMNLRVRNYYWQEDYHPNKQDKKLIGFIAQEFEEVFPGLVSEHKIKGGEPILDEDGNETGERTPEVYKKGIKEAKLIPILVKALQEAVERIETLEQRLSDAGIA